MSISEILGLDGDTIDTQEIFKFQQEGVSGEGRIYGRFRSTGETSRYLDHFKTHGINISDAGFELDLEV